MGNGNIMRIFMGFEWDAQGISKGFNRQQMDDIMI